MEQKLTSRWAVEQRNFFLSRKVAKDKTDAIFCSIFAVTGSISFKRGPSWKRFPHGDGRNFSAALARRSSRLPTKSKSEANSQVFQTWCGGRSNYFSTTLADTSSWSM